MNRVSAELAKKACKEVEMETGLLILFGMTFTKLYLF